MHLLSNDGANHEQAMTRVAGRGVIAVVRWWFGGVPWCHGGDTRCIFSRDEYGILTMESWAVRRRGVSFVLRTSL